MNAFIPAWLRSLFITALLAACVAGGYRLLHTGEPLVPDMTPAEATKKEPAPGLEQIRPGWWETRQRIYFDIPARVLFRMPDTPGRAAAVAGMAWAEFDRIGRVFNPYAPDSETSLLNAADGRAPVPVSTDLWRVLQLSKTLWRASNGAFDPTMLPIKRLWQEAVDDQQVPSTRLIQATLSKVGFGKVRLLEDSRAVESEKGMQFDFGGVAKGYAVDRVVARLKENGVTEGLVQLGGEIAAFGENDGSPWRIGVQHPLDMAGVWGILSAHSKMRVSTSGNYRQPLVIAGHRFYHIFSPETGTPVSEKILGVTTADFSGTASNALLDGAATAITVMGSDAGLKMARELGIEALIIKESHHAPIEIMTDGFRDHYEPHP